MVVQSNGSPSVFSFRSTPTFFPTSHLLFSLSLSLSLSSFFVGLVFSCFLILFFSVAVTPARFISCCFLFMFPGRMSRGLPSHMLLFIIAFVYTITAAPLNPSAGLDSFVPSCAIQCFDSFLNISYGDQTARTLEALCALIGAHGFTIAEAAVQCLVAERAAGACSYQVASNEVIDKAYFMCYGQPGALSPTHSVLTATFGVPVHGTGPITFPAVATTGRQTSTPTAISRETQSSISLPTTLVTDTTSLLAPGPSMTGSTLQPTATTTAIGRTTTPSTTSFRSSTQAEAVTTDPTSLAFTKTTAATTNTSTGTSVPNGIVGGQGEKKASTPLSNGQVAGIAIGSIAGVGLIGAGIAFFCRCLRRRRSQFGRKMRKDGRLLRDSWGGPEKPNGDGGTDSWIVNQLRAPLDPGPASTPTKSWYNRASWRPSAIGLAITPTRTRDVSQAATPTSARPLSKLLPAKPTMGQGPPRLEVSLPSQEGDSHFGAAAFMSTAAASGAVMSGAIPASSSPTVPATREQTTTKQFAQTRNLTPPRIVLPSPSLDSPRGKPQSPLLKLIIPKKGAFKPFVPIPIPNTRHDSSTTEFEEDGRTSLSPGGQIWRPPSAEPLSAAPYYVADKNGNWRLGDPRRAQEIAELEASISPLTAGPRSAAVDLEFVKVATRREATKAAAKIRAAEQSREDSLGMRMAPEKTIRAVEPSLSSDEEIQEQEQPYAPRPLFNNNLTVPRRLSSHRRSSTRSLTRPRITSTDSNVTAFSTTSTEEDSEPRAPPAMEQVGSLSPVVESPRSPRPRRGQSPTQYPKIPASLTATTGNLNIEMATSKGGNAAAAAAAAAAVSPTQKSSNFRAPLAAATMSSNDGKSKRPMASSPNAIMAGSPRMKMQPNASSSRPYPPPPQQNQQMPYRLPPHPSAYRPNIDPSGYPYQTRLSAFNQGPMAYAPQQDRYPRQQQQQQQQAFYPPSSATSSFYPSDIPQIHHHPLLTRTSASTHISSSSAADSLLAKRLGTSRAADMALLPVPQPAMTASSSQNKWLRQGQYQQPSTPEMPSPAELPATPVWKPRLTPTRRGDDLYLIAR
ncbi:hypothetical protein ACQKWADRAFT_177294 [Trichoderma austrokoningii]